MFVNCEDMRQCKAKSPWILRGGAGEQHRLVTAHSCPLPQGGGDQLGALTRSESAESFLSHSHPMTNGRRWRTRGGNNSMVWQAVPPPQGSTAIELRSADFSPHPSSPAKTAGSGLKSALQCCRHSPNSMAGPRGRGSG